VLFNKQYHTYINWLGIALLLVGLPLSKFLMSLSQIVLGLNWILSGNHKQKLQELWNRKELVLLAGIFVVHVIGLFWSSDFEYGFNDIKKKLPLLVYPVVFSSIDIVPQKELFVKFLKLFVLCVLLATLLSMFKYFGVFWEVPLDPRELSVFYSHIRFGLIINVTIFVSLYLSQNSNGFWRVVWLVFGLWLVVFSFILQSLTSVFILLILFIIFVFLWPTNLKLRKVKLVVGLVLFLLMIFAGIKVNNLAVDQLIPKQNQTDALKQKTPLGNDYQHFLQNKILENGYFVYINISYPEVENSWNKRSSFKIRGFDNKGQPIKSTLVRFLTSKGWEKNGETVNQLSNQEIAAIENGVTNVDHIDIGSFELRIRETIWEIGAYFSGKNPGGNTLIQRFEFWRVAFAVIEKNMLIGVGTGDVNVEEMIMYDTINSVIAPEYRKRAHNQYLTIWVALGILGLLYFLITLIYPFFRYPVSEKPLFFVLLIIGLLSFLNEDTLETQVGITFFAGLYCFLLLNTKRDHTIPDNIPS
jgi:hypothetical protein